MARAAKEKGLVNIVEHVPDPYTGKSKHTIDFAAAIDPQTMDNARVLLTRGTGKNHSDTYNPRLDAIREIVADVVRS